MFILVCGYPIIQLFWLDFKWISLLLEFKYCSQLTNEVANKVYKVKTLASEFSVNMRLGNCLAVVTKKGYQIGSFHQEYLPVSTVSTSGSLVSSNEAHSADSKTKRLRLYSKDTVFTTHVVYKTSLLMKKNKRQGYSWAKTLLAGRLKFWSTLFWKAAVTEKLSWHSWYDTAVWRADADYVQEQ